MNLFKKGTFMRKPVAAFLLGEKFKPKLALR